MKSVEARRLLALMLAAAVVVPAARGMWLNLPSSGPKCIAEELLNNVDVMVDYFCFYGDEDDENSSTLTPTMSVEVSSPYGNGLYHKKNVSHGRFAFTTTEAGNYVACFWVDGGDQTNKTVTVGLEWKTGVAAKDGDSVSTKEKLKGPDLELRKLEVAVQSIHENLNYLISRLRTSSTNENPEKGLHYCANSMRDDGCGFFEREDKFMCARSKAIITVLLRRLNNLEGEITELRRENTVKKLAEEKATQGWGKTIFFGLMILICLPLICKCLCPHEFA